MTRKTGLYLKNGVRAVWLVYPKRNIVQVLHDAEHTEDFGIEDSLTLPAPLPKAKIQVKDIFYLRF